MVQYAIKEKGVICKYWSGKTSITFRGKKSTKIWKDLLLIEKKDYEKSQIGDV